MHKLASQVRQWIAKPVRMAQRRQAFGEEYRQFAKLNDGRFSVDWADRFPQLNDRTTQTGFDAHYVYHTAWAARMVRQENPLVHVDVSSLLYFSAIVSAFVSVQFYDYRPAAIALSNLQSLSADLTHLDWPSGTVASLSCMHTIEHVGLGRYGDPIDPTGDLKAAGELSRVLTPGGLLLIVLPVGKPKIMFNAHRIYAYEQVTAMFPGLSVEQFALLTDDSRLGLIETGAAELVSRQRYGCGCFAFRKSL